MARPNRLPDLPQVLIDLLPAGLEPLLGEELKNTTVVGTRPGNMSDDPVVLVVNTGGTGHRDRILYTSQVTIDAYAPTDWWAGQLARLVSEVIHSLPAGENPVALVRSTAPTELPDPRTDLARYTCTYQITTRLPGGN